MLRSLFLLPIFLFLLSFEKIAAQDTAYLSKPPMLIARLDGEIQFDGLSDEPAWQKIPSVPFIAYQPVWGAPMTEKTELRLAYDDRYLYVAGRCYTKDVSTIIDRNLVRDGWRGDDWLAVHFDSRFDHQNALVFSVYPSGARFDMMTSNDAIELGTSTFNDAFNMIWDAKVIRNKEGWFFEMKIPLFNLRFSKNNAGEVLMAVSATRGLESKQEFHQFPAASRNIPDAFMKPSIKQPVVFKELNRSGLLLATPYVAAGSTKNYHLDKLNSGYTKNSKNNFDAGIDIKAGLSSYLTLDATINPDFAQAEADDQQVNLSRFSLFFPEKRLFFQEQAGLFEFVLGGNAQLFYSRRIGINEGAIVPIYGGQRLTGKLNSRTDIGALSMQTANQTLDDSTAIGSENFSVLRLRRKVFNERSFLGGMITSRTGNSNQNFAFGFDGLINFGKTNYLMFSAASTVSKYDGKKEALSFATSRFTLSLDNRKREGFIYRGGYIYSGADFNPQTGFVNRSNMHNPSMYFSWGKFSNDKKAKFQYQEFTLARAKAYWNATHGYLESLEAGMGWKASTFKSLNLSLQLVNNYEYVADSLDFGNNIIIRKGNYNSPGAWLFITPPKYQKIQVPITLSQSRFFGGDKFYAAVNPTINLGRHLEIITGYEINNINIPGSKAELIQVARLKLNYALNLHLSANLNMQYVSTQEKMYVNARLRYNFSDGHDLYVVFNNISNTNSWYNNTLKNPRLEQVGFLVKYNYTFRLMK